MNVTMYIIVRFFYDCQNYQIITLLTLYASISPIQSENRATIKEKTERVAKLAPTRGE